MSKSNEQYYKRRLDTLKRRRDFLDKRVINYAGKDMSRDKAEASALHWALEVIEGNYKYAVDCIAKEKKEAI